MKKSKRDKTVKNVKLKNSENLNPRLSVGKDAEKAKQFYWDLYQGVSEPVAELTVIREYQDWKMSPSKAKSVLGLWRKGGEEESKEDITEDNILEAFIESSKVIETGGRNNAEYTLVDIHEAYQVLLKNVSKRRKLRLMDVPEQSS